MGDGDLFAADGHGTSADHDRSTKPCGGWGGIHNAATLDKWRRRTPEDALLWRREESSHASVLIACVESMRPLI